MLVPHLGGLAVFSYQFLGLVRSRYFCDPEVDHLFMVEDLEDRIIGTPHLFVGKQGDVITAVADYQMVRETAV